MGFLELLLGKENPVAQWAGDNSNALSALGAGIASGPTFGRGVAAGLDNLPRARLLDMQLAQQEGEKAKEEQVRNYTKDWLTENRPDLLPGLEMGMSPAELYSEAMKPQAGPEPFTLGQGETRYAGDGSIIAQGPPKEADPKEAFNMEKDISSQYLGTDPVKTFQAVRNGYEKIRASAQTNSGPGDISMIFAYMKMLDPTSVVREGEFATAENAGGVGAQVSNLYNKLLTGERLTPELRKQFLKAADSLYAESASNLSDTNTQFSNRSAAWGVDPGRFVITPETYDTLDLDAVDPLGLR